MGKDRMPGVSLGPEPDRLDFIELAMSRTDRAVLISDAAHRPCYVNPAFTALFGHDLEDLERANPWTLLAGPITDERLHARARQSSEDGAGFYDDLLLRTKGGDPVWVSAKIEPIFDAQGTFTHLVAMLSDITRAKRLQGLQREVIEALAQDVPIERVMKTICLQVEALAPGTVCSILRIDENNRIRPLAAPSIPQSVAAAIDGLEIGPRAGSCGTAAWRGEPVLVEDIATDPLWDGYRDLIMPLGLVACWSHPMMLRSGRVAGTFAFYFTERQGPDAWHVQLVEACLHLCVMAIERFEARAQIRRLAYYDALTGLPNRVLLRQRLEQTLIADQERRKKIGLLCIDINQFKDVNDAFGQPVGDMMLGAVSQRLLARASSADMVSRMSGDAFAIVLDDCDAQRAARVAQEVIAELLEPFEVAGSAIPLSCSVGIALYPEDSGDVDELLRHCETALLEAKTTTRGGYNFFSPAMNALNTDRLTLAAALREALAGDQLSLVYQPQIDRERGGLYGVEALARWTHPELGPIAPDRFIRVAEQIGVIEALGSWALDTACRQLADWRARGLDVPAMSVNVSAQQFRNRQFHEEVARRLDETGLAPGDLTIEITESLMLDHSAVVVANVRALAGAGVRLSMDDFGTGYSSLSLIARLPVRELKIDRAFIDKLADDQSAQAVATAVICIGQTLNMSVVAEGVETEAQRRFLDALGCHAHQGYLHGRPMDVAGFEAWSVAFSQSIRRKRA